MTSPCLSPRRYGVVLRAGVPPPAKSTDRDSLRGRAPAPISLCCSSTSPLGCGCSRAQNSEADATVQVWCLCLYLAVRLSLSLSLSGEVSFQSASRTKMVFPAFVQGRKMPFREQDRQHVELRRQKDVFFVSNKAHMTQGYVIIQRALIRVSLSTATSDLNDWSGSGAGGE